jgi:hypothetical protein
MSSYILSFAEFAISFLIFFYCCCYSLIIFIKVKQRIAISFVVFFLLASIYPLRALIAFPGCNCFDSIGFYLFFLRTLNSLFLSYLALSVPYLKKWKYFVIAVSLWTVSHHLFIVTTNNYSDLQMIWLFNVPCLLLLFLCALFFFRSVINLKKNDIESAYHFWIMSAILAFNLTMFLFQVIILFFPENKRGHLLWVTYWLVCNICFSFEFLLLLKALKCKKT